MNSINVFEQPMPGLGQRFEFDLDDNQALCVVALRDGRRQIAMRRFDEDAAVVLIELDRDQAATMGALLLGAQFSMTRSTTEVPVDQVSVETITVVDDAPAIGTSARQALADLKDEVVVLAVIRDQTSEIVEHDPNLALTSGDQVAVAARRSAYPSILEVLTGAGPAPGDGR